MKIVVNAIPQKGMDVEEEIGASDLNLETGQIHYPAGVNVKAHIEKDKDVINVTCSIRSRKKQTCSRCLSEFESPVEKDINFVYRVGGEHTIELDDNIKDAIILDYPMKILCKQDCKGFCSQCGKNLNEGPCECNIDD